MTSGLRPDDDAGRLLVRAGAGPHRGRAAPRAAVHPPAGGGAPPACTTRSGSRTPTSTSTTTSAASALPAPAGTASWPSHRRRSPASPLDRSRPLWEMWVIEGLKDDRVGLVAKVHHSAIDGVAGAELMVHLSTSSRRREPATAPPTAARRAHPERPRAAHLRRRVDGCARTHAASCRLVRRTVGSVARRAQRRAEPSTDAGGAARSPRPARRGTAPSRRTAASRFARVSLDDIKTIEERVPAPRSTTWSSRRAPARCAATCRTAASCPTSRSSPSARSPCAADDQHGHAGNQVSAMFTRLPTDIDDPVERLRGDPAAHRGRQGRARRLRRRHAAALGRVRRPNLRPGCPPLLRAPARPTATGRSTTCHLQRARAAVPAVPRRRRARAAPTRWARSWRAPG